jgi:hypothetical protein
LVLASLSGQDFDTEADYLATLAAQTWVINTAVSGANQNRLGIDYGDLCADLPNQARRYCRNPGLGVSEAG